MRYSVHPSRAFHNRITKDLGVLVAAALIATLGLPSAVQAQTPAPPTVTGEGDGTRRGDRRHHYCNVGGGGDDAGDLVKSLPGIWSNIQSLANHGPTRRRCTSTDLIWLR